MTRGAPLAEMRMTRASLGQVEAWNTAAARDGYRSTSEWMRAVLDRASGVDMPIEVVGDEKAIAIYVPNRATDPRPFFVELARYDTPKKLLELILETRERPWCTSPAIKLFLQALRRASEESEARPTRRGAKAASRSRTSARRS